VGKRCTILFCVIGFKQKRTGVLFMRVAFMGKGGSGKTTLTASFITYLARYKQKPSILAIDADVNMHLQHALGMTGQVVPLSEHAQTLFSLLEGERSEWRHCTLRGVPAIGSIPPSSTSHFISPHTHAVFLDTYALNQHGISLCAVGTHRQQDVSNTCYHNKLNVLECILHHLLDTERDFVVVDSTAGIDNLGTSLFMAYDLTLFVVEPTKKSLRVFHDYLQQVQHYPLQVKVVINKVCNEDDVQFVRQSIAEDAILGYLPCSKHMRAFEQGDLAARHLFIKDNQELWESIITALAAYPRDWTMYQYLLQTLFTKECQGWWNRYYEQEFEKIISPTFRYQDMLKQEVSV
jgi:CO dehydrogenase maturation factor